MSTLKCFSFLIGLSLVVGCQKSSTELNASDSASVAEAANAASACKSVTAPVDPALLLIESHPSAQAGTAVTYKLNHDLSCSQTQKVVWSAPADSVIAKDGSSLTIQFPEPGQYVVAAKIVSSSNTSSLQVAKAGSESATLLATQTLVVAEAPVISGPQVATASSLLNFSIAAPAGMTIVSAVWNFGDGKPTVSGLGTVTHKYDVLGNYVVTASVTDAGGNTFVLNHAIQVLDVLDGLSCVSSLAISGPTTAQAGSPVSLSLFVPTCLNGVLTRETWNFGDGTATGSGLNTSHAYTTPGTYTVTLTINSIFSPSAPWITLTRQITIVEALPVPTPIPSPTPSPTPAPTPVPNPLSCPTVGAQRTSYSTPSNQTLTCGLNGTKTQTTRIATVEKCQSTASGPLWTVISRTTEVVSETACSNQSCLMQDGSILAHGATQIGVVTGEVKSPLTCQFGEEGYFNLYNQISDLTCTNGSLSTNNTRQGDLKSAGVCPTYAWSATDNWSLCSADCGGKQNRIYECQSNLGQSVSADHCASAMPVEERVCDGNPTAVAKTERVTTQEESGSTKLCPANQIGVVLSTRDVTQVNSYACINHAVSLASSTLEYGAWVTESYCRDYVPHRCSQDSLSNDEARGRYKWMLKCENKLPAVHEFLENLTQLNTSKNNDAIYKDGRILYATFMNPSVSPEKPWIAPKSDKGSCEMPNNAYVAAVCLASCATPEQEILAQAEANLKLKYVPFVEALTQNYKFVATLQSNSSMSSKDVVKTRVDNWITELIDTDHDIVEFKMKSGRSLRLTPNHPVVTEFGTIKLADEFAPGESLVVLGGTLDPIVSIKHTVYHGKVYNVFVQSAELHKNIVVTNGYLNGTAFFQNEGAKNLNRAIFRNRMLRGAF